MASPERQSIHDEALPGAHALLDPSAAETLGPAMRAAAGFGVASLKPVQALYEPGRDLHVTYDALLELNGGRTARETLVLHTGRDGAEGSVVFDAAGASYGAWRFPHDPRLPGLAAATDPGFVEGLLRELGAPSHGLRLDTRAYRPCRRAIVEATATDEMKLVLRPGRGLRRAPPVRLLFLKVVRAERVERLERKHRRLAEHVSVPRCYGREAELGILVLEALPGRTLWEQVRRDLGQPPDGHQLARLLDRFASVGLGGSPRRTASERAAFVAPMLRAIVPDEAERVDRFLADLGDDSPEPLVTVHGDLHEEQILVSERGIEGLLDVDDAGPGQRIDDLATLVGRFWSFAEAMPGRPQVGDYARDLLAAFGELVDPLELRRRAAGILLARATAPFRTQRPEWRAETVRRIAVAEDWLRRVARAGEPP